MSEEPKAQWGDPRVQKVYDILSNTEDVPPPEQHWEGWAARRIVDALSAPADVQPLTDVQIDSINRSTEWPSGSLAMIGDKQWLLLFRHAARAIERAYGIPAPTTDTGEQQR